MTLNGWLQVLIFFALLAAITIPLGAYLFRVFDGRRTWLDPVLRPMERGI
jgi:K+-transporting ATPase ATPase A chain